MANDLALLVRFNQCIEEAVQARVAAEAAYGHPQGTGLHVGDTRMREYCSSIEQASVLLDLMETELRTTLAGVLLAVKQGAKLR